MIKNCKCTPDETTGNTEFQKGILSCNICGGFVAFKSIDMEDILQKEETQKKIKTPQQNFSMVKGKAIAGIVLLPEKGSFRAYIAWEWEKQARQGNFTIVESTGTIDKENISEFVDNVSDYGNDVTHRIEIRKLFGRLFPEAEDSQ